MSERLPPSSAQCHASEEYQKRQVRRSPIDRRTSSGRTLGNTHERGKLSVAPWRRRAGVHRIIIRILHIVVASRVALDTFRIRASVGTGLGGAYLATSALDTSG